MKRAITTFLSLLFLAGISPRFHALGQGATVFFLEDFDGVTPPQLPAGWTDANALWQTSSSVASTGSGLNNLTIAGGQPATVETPVIDLSGLISGTIEYLVRRTSTYPQDSLILRASTDGGLSFPLVLLDMGGALPATDGSYASISVAVPAELVGQPSVVLSFNARGGSTSGSNLRIDDVQVTGEGEAAAPVNYVGFTAATGAVDPSTDTFEASLLLDFSGANPLQGLQFSVDWDVAGVTLADVVPETPIANQTDWQLDYELTSGGMKGVLLGNELTGLSSGLYDPLVTLQFSVDPASAAGEVVLTLSQVIGALAVPTGDDAGLTIGQATHTVTLTPAAPEFVPDATSLDAGTVTVGSTATVQVVVSNPGTGELAISSVSSSNGLFSVDPGAATVPAGGSQTFTVSYSPTFTEFGYQEASLVFAHNAAGGSNTLNVVGLGVGGRGDVSEDGLVDALDIVTQVDFILERIAPSPEQLSSGDLFPFGSPDGVLDVRDLTVLAQAVVLGEWPDALPIPSEPAASKSPSMSTLGIDADESVQVEMVEENGQARLYLNRRVPLRAVQISMDAGALTSPPVFDRTTTSDGVNTLYNYDSATGELRVVMFRSDGGLIESGRHELAYWPAGVEVRSIEPQYSIAVDADRKKIPIAFESTLATGVDPNDDRPGSYDVGLPYPNPFNASRDGSVTLTMTLMQDDIVRAEVFDVLGRSVGVVLEGARQPGQHRVVWDGMDAQGRPAAGGLYFVRIEAGGDAVVRTVVVE